MSIYPDVLIISNKFDFSTDLITHKLKEFKVEFLRLNRDQLGEYQIELDVTQPCLRVKIDNLDYVINEINLKSIYYRAPTFLRDIVQENLSDEEQLYRTQWAAFVRSLAIFENVKWVNNPIDTYKAEMKPLQLFYAHKIGFKIPKTVISNSTAYNPDKKFAIKSIDTAIINNNDLEAFVYTTIIDGNQLEDITYSSPFFIQQALIPKIDVRITIVNEVVVAIKIKSNELIDVDWRKFKGDIKYEIYELPEDIRQKCLKYSKLFNLTFSAIDMVIYDEEHYFIEINPTGEWAWLQKNTGYEFDRLIAKTLQNEYLG